ncbi:MAG: UDP-3-O-acylglucosamine N-acyltransferase [Betaproteobacteria bacterium ADurb.Bin341]|nr:MAG: UDP-3-O-acylglucosamine N-acyltransferase [Betaproteobacteria bacterium ADurb.Bin341]
MPVAGSQGLTLKEIAALLGGDVLGDGETRVSQVGTLLSAGSGQISFLTNPKYRAQLDRTRASAVILSAAAADSTALPRIVSSNPYAYYARVTALLNPVRRPVAGVHSTASCASPVPASASIGAGVSIGSEVELGEEVVIHSGCAIGDGVKIGPGSVLYPNVVVYAGCSIGRNAIIHSGAVIGSDGFGFAPEGGTWVKIPQIGAVRIGDDVEIGANTSIDRGALDDTVIEEGCKLDNQIQIAHNCVIGARTVIAGCVGIAGSTKIGKGCMLGGAAMILGHLEIADGTVISPGSMVMKSIAKPGKYTALFPLEEHERWLRNAAQVRHLARLAERVSTLEKMIEELTKKG